MDASNKVPKISSSLSWQSSESECWTKTSLDWFEAQKLTNKNRQLCWFSLDFLLTLNLTLDLTERHSPANNQIGSVTIFRNSDLSNPTTRPFQPWQLVNWCIWRIVSLAGWTFHPRILVDKILLVRGLSCDYYAKIKFLYNLIVNALADIFSFW